MLRLTPQTARAFGDWLQHAPRPHTAVLRHHILTIDRIWEVDLKAHGTVLHDTWTREGGTRLLWTREGTVAELLRFSRRQGWGWVRSATTAWRVLHSSKGRPLPDDIGEALREVVRDQGAARFALDATRLEAVLANSTARGIRVDIAALDTVRADMKHTHELAQDLLGFDPLLEQNDPATLCWLTKHGVDVAGVRSEDWSARTSDGSAKAAAAEDAYAQILHLRRRYPKVRELTAMKKRGALHTILEPFAQVSGRISSTRPALNNVAKDLRYLLVARPEHAFVTADFDGIEPRVLAALSGDQALARDLINGDPYADAAERAGFDRVEHRNVFKLVIISTMYGAGPGRTARQLNVPLQVARQIRTQLWEPYPVAAAWLSENVGRHGMRLDSGRPLGIVEDAYARPNLLIQSTAYDIFQAAALRVHDHLPDGAPIALPMHDELIVETPARLVQEVVEVLGRLMPSEVRGVRIGATPVVLGPRWRKV